MKMDVFHSWVPTLVCAALLLAPLAMLHAADAQKTAGSDDWLTLDSKTLEKISVAHGKRGWVDDPAFGTDRALTWEYEAGGTLTLPYLGKPLGYSAYFFLAFFQEAPVPDGRTFTVEFSHGREAPVCTLQFKAKRRDWNRVELSSSERYATNAQTGIDSVKGFITKAVDTVTIRAPAGKPGRLLIGQYALAEKELVRPDTVGLHVYPEGWAVPPAPALAAEDLKAFQLIEARVERELREEPNPEMFTNWSLEEVRRRISELGIRRTEKGWRGLNVTVDTVNEQGYRSKERDYSLLMAHLAHLYIHASDEALRKELLARFFELWDFQRYIGGMPDSWAGGDGYLEAAFLLRQPLRASGRLTADVLAEVKDRLALERIYTDKSVAMMSFRGRTYRPGELGEDCDYTRMSIQRLLITILMGPDSPEKARDLRALSTWLDRVVLQYSPGLCDTFKPDGSTFHHQSFIPGYGSGSLLALSRTLYELSATPYAVSPRGHGFFRDVLLRYRLLLRENTLPLTLGGKSGFVRHYNTAQSSAPFLYMTLSGTPDGKQPVDPLVAAAWLRLLVREQPAPPFSTLHQLAQEQCRTLGLAAEPIPAGHWTWPYGALAVHRHADWLLQVKGHSRYIYAREAGGSAGFPMVTFLGYGTLELLTAKDFTEIKDNRSYHNIDFGKPGFDWARFPGTTTPLLPPARIAWSGWKQYFSDQAFVGGLDGPDGNGLFALALHGAKEVKLDSFVARKSWHYFGGTVLCLGSGISSGLTDDEHGTTLFQEEIGKTSEPVMLDGNPLAAVPAEEKRHEASWLMDAHGNGYHVPAGQELVVRRSAQISRDADDKADTKGSWSTAWLSHGRGPKSATYRYVLLPQAKREEVEAFHLAMASQPPLKVVRLDAAAHIVKSTPDKTFSYALFEAAPALADGPILSASRACLAQVKRTAEGLSLYVSDPDLNLDDTGARRNAEGKVSIDDWGYSRPSKVRLVLSGTWTASSAPWLSVKAEGDCTTLEVSLKDGATRTIPLTGKLSAVPEASAPETSAGWKKFEGNPVMGGQYGTCFDISVLRDGDKYRMWLSWRPKKSIALVESKDGIHWSEPPQVVFGPRTETGWEDVINRPYVLKRADGYHLWYTGQAKGRSWIGYATSSDGVTWKRMSDKPALTADEPWEKNIAVMCPSVLWDEQAKLFRMWYSGGEQNEPNAIGYATSADGLTWKKHEANPIFTADPKSPWEKHKVTACQVEKVGDWHVMFYIGFENEGTARICLARSKDGITNWQRHSANPVIFPGKDKWDHDACYKPYAIFDGAKWLLWYNGRHGSLEQIGVALHEGEGLGFDQ